jgi:hypothetical protein
LRKVEVEEEVEEKVEVEVEVWRRRRRRRRGGDKPGGTRSGWPAHIDLEEPGQGGQPT